MVKHFLNILSKTTKPLLLVVSICLLYSASQADVLELTNGDRITGELKGIDGGIVEFETVFAGTLRVKQSEVKLARTGTVYTVVNQSGERDEVALDSQVKISDIKRAWISKSVGGFSVASVENQVALSASYSHGNSTTQVYVLTGKSEIKRASSEHIFETAVHQDSAEGEQLKNQTELSYKTRRYFREDWFYAFNFDAYRDAVKSIDLRLSPTLGLGHKFWENTYGKLSVEAGIAAVIEDLETDRREKPAISWELDYQKRLYGGRLEAFHQHRFLLGSADGYVLDSANGFTVAVSERVDLNLLAKLKHDTSVPEGSKQTDIAYVAGLGLNF